MAGRKPKNDFTDRVMAGVRSQPRKIGAWNLVYFIPVIVAITLLSLPSTRSSLQNLVDHDRGTVNEVQSEVDEIQKMVNSLDAFDDQGFESVNNQVSE